MNIRAIEVAEGLYQLFRRWPDLRRQPVIDLSSEREAIAALRSLCREGHIDAYLRASMAAQCTVSALLLEFLIRLAGPLENHSWSLPPELPRERATLAVLEQELCSDAGILGI